jgi:hypothetical protein
VRSMSKRPCGSSTPAGGRVDEQPMPDTDFTAAILETEVVVKDITDGHIFHFPILGNGTVSLHGVRIEANPDAKRLANRYMLDAHNAARAHSAERELNQALPF